MWQSAPLAPRAVQVQNGIDHFAHIGGSGVSSWLGGRDQRFEDPPLVVGHITGVAASLHLSTSSLHFSLSGHFFLFYSSSIISSGRHPCRAALQADASALVFFHLASQGFAHSLLVEKFDCGCFGSVYSAEHLHL